MLQAYAVAPRPQAACELPLEKRIAVVHTQLCTWKHGLVPDATSSDHLPAEQGALTMLVGAGSG